MADLSHARAKLGRAKKHISDVEAGIRAFLATDFYRMRVQPNQREGRMEIIFDSLHKPDQSLNVIVGDAISNLRSALDYAVVALTGNQKAAFPNADQLKGFKGEVQAGFIGKTVPTAVPIFIDKIQAYERGNGHAIWVLNKLRNIDKHRFLLTTVQLAGVIMSWRDRNENVWTDCGMSIKAGASGTFIDAPLGHIQITSQPRPTFEVLLREPPYVPDVPILNVLKATAKSVEECLAAIEAFVP